MSKHLISSFAKANKFKSFAPQQKIRATYMRGGTSKGLFFLLDDLPVAARKPGAARDAIWLRAIGSPDPYGKQIDGIGNGSSSTSKAVLISKSARPGFDVDYLFGQVAIDRAFVDWSGNCGNLSAAVGPFAIANGLVDAARGVQNGVVSVRIWQANIGKAIIAHVPICDAEVQETGDFELDGVTFPAAEIVLEFLDPAGDDDAGGSSMFPSGARLETIAVPGLPELRCTMISAGIPTIFIEAAALGLSGSEQQDGVNNNPELLAKLELIRAHAALKMGLISDLAEAKTRQHTPKIAWIAAPADYRASSGKLVGASEIDLQVRAMSMGKMHHAMMGTAGVAIATAAAVPGTLVSEVIGGALSAVRFGHPSGTLRVGASTVEVNGDWQVSKAEMSRSARVIMEGFVRV
jgi:2-methylaconitate isomerase